MTWAQRLKRAFNIDIETCGECGGTAKVIACIEAPVVIEKILTHLDETVPAIETIRIPESRGRRRSQACSTWAEKPDPLTHMLHAAPPGHAAGLRLDGRQE